MARTREEIQDDRRRLKAEYLDLFDRVSELLFRIDPVGINFEVNTDEYESETGTILPRLKYCSTVEEARRMIHEEFVRWFDRETAGPESHYSEIAQEIWELWKKRDTAGLNEKPS
jgi:sulfatase maturation enzyme AslB (radical SAM superfamily)